MATMSARYTVIDGEVMAQERGGVRHQLVPDPLGSTVALYDDLGNKVNSFDYWPYGEQTASASLLSIDTSTQGSWASPGPSYVYGSEGYYMPNASGDLVSLPAYASLSVTGESKYTWSNNNDDARALVTSPSFVNADRIATCDYASTSFYYDLALTDGKAHQVALYLLDWDSNGRSMQIDVTVPSTSQVLLSETISSFASGKYLVMSLSGTVRIILTKVTGANAVLSGIFFATPANLAATVTPFRFVGTYGYYQDSANRNYVRARYLDSKRGRWITADKYWIDEGLYKYVHSNSLTLIDPSGNISIKWGEGYNREPWINAKEQLRFKTIMEKFRDKMIGDYTRAPSDCGCNCWNSNKYNEKLETAINYPTFVTKVKRLCSSILNIDCKTGPECKSSGNRKSCETKRKENICGCSKVGEDNNITICTDATNKGRCGCLSLTLIHELIHTYGQYDEYYPECISDSCSKNLPC